MDNLIIKTILTLTITGLLMTALIAITSLYIDKGKNAFPKIVVIALIIAGFSIAIFKSYYSEKEKEALNNEKQKAEKERTLAQQKLDDLKKIMDLTNVTLGNLATLDQLSGNDKYYVRIAGDRRKENLEPF